MALRKHEETLMNRWVFMICRCHNPADRHYKWYGARGIRVCDRWRYNFNNYYKDIMAKGFDSHLQIDREDNDGDYTPENVRCVTVEENRANRSEPVKEIEYNGVKKTISQWADELGINKKTIHTRLRLGWNEKDVLCTEVGSRANGNAIKMLEFNGKNQTIKEWSDETGLYTTTIYSRLRAGWSVKDALTKPIQTNSRDLEYNGVQKPLEEWAKELGINIKTLDNRIRLGWSVEQALTTPVKKQCKISMKSKVKRSAA